MEDIIATKLPKIYVFSSVADQGKTKLTSELYNLFSSNVLGYY